MKTEMIYDRILGTLYGQAIGDAMGMPPELWTRGKIHSIYGHIDHFLDGNPDNAISYQYHAGNFTDDTSQALVILDSLAETGFRPDQANLARHLLQWAEREDAFNRNILGPTSKATLLAYQEGKDVRRYSDKAVSNGSAMRISPIGTLFPADRKKELCDYTAEVSGVTHTSDITVAGACMAAMAVSSAMTCGSREQMISDVCSVEDYSMSLGAETLSPRLGERIEYGVWLAGKYRDNEDQFLEHLYRMMGAGVNMADSLPCAVAIAYYSWDVQKSAILCANLGGDTDTIGAMSTAICGAAKGFRSIPEEYIRTIDKANHVNLRKYADLLLNAREQILGKS